MLMTTVLWIEFLCDDQRFYGSVVPLRTSRMPAFQKE